MTTMTATTMTTTMITMTISMMILNDDDDNRACSRSGIYNENHTMKFATLTTAAAFALAEIHLQTFQVNLPIFPQIIFNKLTTSES